MTQEQNVQNVHGKERSSQRKHKVIVTFEKGGQEKMKEKQTKAKKTTGPRPEKRKSRRSGRSF